jgi:hypothetical protein
MSISDTTENAILNLVFSSTLWANYATTVGVASLETNIAVALHTADPVDAGLQNTTEAGYGAYARQNVSRTTGWTTASGTAGSVSPAANIDFPASSGAGTTLTHWSTGKTGGAGTAILWSGAISPTIPIAAAGVIPRLTTATTITLD